MYYKQGEIAPSVYTQLTRTREHLQFSDVPYIHIQHPGADKTMVDLIIPEQITPLQINFGRSKAQISDHLNIDKYPQENSSDWEHMNTSFDISSLISDAYKAKGVFSNFLDTVCTKTGAKVLGKDFMIKDQKSAERKIKLWSNSGVNSIEKSTREINDILRGTIVCDTVEQMRDIIAQLVFVAENREVPIPLVFSNKFKEEYNSGYMAVHAKLAITTEDGRTIQAEIQIQPSTTYNGTPDCAKELSHRVNDIGRLSPGEQIIKGLSFEKSLRLRNAACMVFMSAGLAPFAETIPT